MPALGLLMLAAQVLCAAHVERTGRPYWWIFLIVFVPLVGMMVYLAVELLPDLLGSRHARLAASGVAGILNPGGELREAMLRKEIAPTVQNKVALAKAYLAAGQPGCSASLYREALTGHPRDRSCPDAGAPTRCSRARRERPRSRWNASVPPIRNTPLPKVICYMRAALSCRTNLMPHCTNMRR